MIAAFIGILTLVGLIGISLICGWSLLVAAFWLFIKLPVAGVIFIIGLALCCTIILIPLGIMCMKAAFHILVV